MSTIRLINAELKRKPANTLKKHFRVFFDLQMALPYRKLTEPIAKPNVYALNEASYNIHRDQVNMEVRYETIATITQEVKSCCLKHF